MSYLAIIILKSLVLFLSKDVKAQLNSEGIIGGDLVAKSDDRFMYTVSIIMDGHLNCGGAIISEFFIVTSAHCFIGKNNKFLQISFIVVAGHLYATARTRPITRIVKVSVPLEYNNLGTSSVFYANEGDIAVAKVNPGFRLTKCKIIKLPVPTAKFSPTYENRNAIVTGYGWNSIEIQKNSQTGEIEEISTSTFGQLKYANTFVLSHGRCTEIYSRPPISQKYICAQVQQNPKASGICTGDSGGPLVIDDEILIGIADSSVFGCNETVFPGLYVRVTSYIDFILNAKEDINADDMRIAYYT